MSILSRIVGLGDCFPQREGWTIYFNMATKNKTVLIVCAHHYNKSLNASVLDTTVKALKADGCDVIISDLYAQNFNPVMGFQDVTSK